MALPFRNRGNPGRDKRDSYLQGEGRGESLHRLGKGKRDCAGAVSYTHLDVYKRQIQCKKYIKKAFEKHMKGEGFCLVELLSPCPTNLNMTPVKLSLIHI